MSHTWCASGWLTATSVPVDYYKENVSYHEHKKDCIKIKTITSLIDELINERKLILKRLENK